MSERPRWLARLLDSAYAPVEWDPAASRSLPVRLLVDLVVTVVACVVALAIGLPAQRAQGFTIVWSGAVIMGLLVALPVRRWPMLLVVATVANLFSLQQGNHGLGYALIRTAGDLLVFVSAAVVLRRRVRMPLRSATDAGALVVIASVAAVVRMGIGWVAVQSDVRTDYVLLPVILGLTSLIGILVYVPAVVLSVHIEAWRSMFSRRALPAVLWCLIVAGLTGVIFFQERDAGYVGLAFVTVPVIVLLAARYPQFTLAMTLALMATGVALGTVLGLGPFATQARGAFDFRTAALNAQMFLVAVPAAAWLLAGAMAEGRLATAAEVKAREAVQTLVDTDPVTGLHSRTSLFAALEEALQEEPAKRRVAAMFVDLTEFQFVTSALGYEAGDAALRALGERVRANLPQHFVLGRFDGYLLLAVTSRGESVEFLEEAARHVLQVVAEELMVRDSRIARTASVGVAMDREFSTATSMLHDADNALSTAKAKGRSRFHVVGLAGDGMNDSGRRIRAEHELREALEQRQFIAFFQPQYRLDDGRLCGFEALARRQHPDQGLLGPGTFVDTMEASGLVIGLGEQVLRRVCEHLASHPLPEVPVSINVSAIELGDASWFERFAGILREYGTDPTRIIVELTETSVLQLGEDGHEALRGLRDMGVGIHIDDFGTGFTSLGVLQQIPATALKLDISFVREVDDPEVGNPELVRAIASLAEGLGMETIAEGIERPSQAHLLRELGWQVGQGFFLGRPGPDRAIAERVDLSVSVA